MKNEKNTKIKLKGGGEVQLEVYKDENSEKKVSYIYITNNLNKVIIVEKIESEISATIEEKKGLGKVLKIESSGNAKNYITPKKIYEISEEEKRGKRL